MRKDFLILAKKVDLFAVILFVEFIFQDIGAWFYFLTFQKVLQS